MDASTFVVNDRIYGLARWSGGHVHRKEFKHRLETIEIMADMFFILISLNCCFIDAAEDANYSPLSSY